LKSEVELDALVKKRAVARAQMDLYRASAHKLGESAILQRNLEQNLKAAEQEYLLYASKHEEARIGDALDENGILNVAIAQYATEPALPVWPFWSAMCVSLVGAYAFSTGAVFVTDYFDPSFRNSSEIAEFLGGPVLTSLPSTSARAPPEGHMSAGTGVWKPTPVGPENRPRRRQSKPVVPTEFGACARGPMLTLARQVFLPGASHQRKHVLVVGIDRETTILQLSEQLAVAASLLTAGRVALVDTSPRAGQHPGKKNPRNHTGSETSGRIWSDMSKHVSRVPADLFWGGNPSPDVDDCRLQELEKFGPGLLLGFSDT
jgi:hypothetical protein